MSYEAAEILETIRMVQMETLDIRTVTMGISLLNLANEKGATVPERIHHKVTRLAGKLVAAADEVQARYGIPIVNKRVTITPLALLGGLTTREEMLAAVQALDRAAGDIGVDYVGGFSALVHKGFTETDILLLNTLAEGLAISKRVCGSVNVATSRCGINMDAVLKMGMVIKDLAERTRDAGSIGCAKLVVFANAPEDNPFMAGGFHGVGEGEAIVNVGVSGPGVVRQAVERLGKGADLGVVAETVKKTSFKVTRMGELVGREVAGLLGLPFGIVDLSLAPTPAPGDSIANILEAMGLERCGAPGTTAALALLNDAVKKGGLMASSSVGGLSGAFIPVSEDQGMIRAAREGALTIERLEVMTAVCSVGLDMVAVPGDTPAETLAAIIADEAAIGVVNDKTTAVRIIPVHGKKEGESYDYGGLLGAAYVMPVSRFRSTGFVSRGGRIPAPASGARN